MNITRNDAKRGIFISKERPAEDIIRTCDSVTDFVCRKVPLDTLSAEDFSLLNEQGSDGMRYALTRYIRDKETKHAYLVFEKTSPESIEEFSSPKKPILLEQE